MADLAQNHTEFDKSYIKYLERSYSQTDTRDSLIPITSVDTWRSFAKCLGMTHLFFQPEKERPQSKERRVLAAKAICETCSVVAQCLDYANTNIEHGIWGGLTEEERGTKPYAAINTRQFRKIN